ncbi:MAG: Hsp20 family protein [Proteobacteria bacterium]|nr:Hsp20 family protein [Pseudomonadota bacterium]
MRAYDFSPLFRYSVGFDRLQRLMDSALERTEVSYPPYNIESVDENAYRITVAVAGFGEGDLDVTVVDDTLTISGKKEDEDKSTAYLHRGIAERAFQLKFNLADHVKVRDAALENGVLVVTLEREVPEELKPRKIPIGTSLAGKVGELAELKKAA